MKRSIATIVGALLAVAASGCAPEQAAMLPPATQPADPEQQADPNYWLAQPGVGSVSGADFDTLWTAAETVARNYLFTIDRRDRRDGLLTTQPNVSAQWFEPWRRELQTGADIADASLATYRRTIHFRFEKTEGGQYVVTPKVLVERQAVAERRVTAVLDRSHFRRDPNLQIYGTRETDQGIYLPPNYWYPVARDHAFEQKLIDDLRAAVK